ncbi:MAG: hypothetical protein HUU28_11605 [Planctomycetaceae bacterium]|nr:hypothetical protein [Planctomycetaceae bacterium]
MNAATTSLAARQLALACALVALGGVLLGLQVDGNGELVGTGYTSLGVGAVVALGALIFAAWKEPQLPRDALTTLSALSGFLGLAFLVSGVLAPGGGWMFFEVLVLLFVLSRAATRREPLTRPAIALLALMLLFRLWISYQGSQHRWQLMSLDVPVLSSLPFEFLAPIQSVQLGEFTPRELGFPPAGLDFAPSLALWAAGFALCVTGLAWRTHASIEYENDRIHDTIHELPPALAQLVERVLPESQWVELGLHGLSERRLRKRLEELLVSRIAARRELERALQSPDLLASTNPGGFPGEIYRALTAGADGPEGKS